MMYVVNKVPRLKDRIGTPLKQEDKNIIPVVIGALGAISGRFHDFIKQFALHSIN